MTTLLMAVATIVTLAQTPETRRFGCQPSGVLVRVAGVAELSGLAVSRAVPGRLWAHNDSGEPTLFALSEDGAVTGRVQLNGVTLEDWEAVSVGPCPAGSCVYAADIGDNNAARRRIAVYRFPEPVAQTSVTVTDVFYATYPDSPQDAETLLVTPDGGFFIVTKGDRAAVALYRFPRDLRVGTNHPLLRVAAAPGPAKMASNDRVTDGTVSADGRIVALRTSSGVTFYRAVSFLAGQWTTGQRVDLRLLREPQGEAVALGDGGTVYVAGEGGAKYSAGTFARLRCTGIQ